jgi:hypothetical protein
MARRTVPSAFYEEEEDDIFHQDAPQKPNNTTDQSQKTPTNGSMS